MKFVLPGKIFGDLTVLGFEHRKINHNSWLCKCRCGKEKLMRAEHLMSGASTSCGHCNYWKDHPLAHKSWDSMRQRCTNPNAPDYSRYGGRGITICREWDRFIDFLDDMGDPPTCAITGNRLSLERIDVEGNYTKNNCKWANQLDQNNNKTNSLHPAIAIMLIRTDAYRKKKR